MTPREAAYQAVVSSVREEQFVHSFLDKWNAFDRPDSRDFGFALELATGTVKRLLTLDHYARQLAALKLKRKEKILLYTALYQAIYMDKVPMHALVNESVALAKKYSHERFAKFLNAVLRKIPEAELTLPQDDLSIAFSYPTYFIQELKKQFSETDMMEILNVGNRPPIVMGRSRLTGRIDKIDDTSKAINSKDIYIQNETPVSLVYDCAKRLTEKPDSILDLCAAPGGKSLLLHDLYPDASLTLNDVSEEKIRRIQDNLTHYGVQAKVTQSRGEDYPSNEQYDLVLIDAPCSNSGVLNKRPEARWRLTPENMASLRSLQSKLIQHGKSLVKPGGQLWYMTCSILRQEHDHPELNQRSAFRRLILPSGEGNDGGFAAVWKNVSSSHS